VSTTDGPVADFERGVVPAGRYAQCGRSPIVWVFLCAACAGFAPFTAEDYWGALSGQCHGCGLHTRELHRFRAWLDTAPGCRCTNSHRQAVGDVRAAANVRRDETAVEGGAV
jgi:hypothetical protein